MSSSLDFGFRKLKSIAGNWRYETSLWMDFFDDHSTPNFQISQQIQSPFMTIKYTKRMTMENSKRTKF